MNKRTARIRSLFTQQPISPLSADNSAPDTPRVASGSVKAVKETFSGIERENEELRRRLSEQGGVVEIGADLIDPSPVNDRFVSDHDAAYVALRDSIRAQGQEVPVLLRPHPVIEGRYQIAYGHRRVRAARELGLPIRATIRVLSDEQLVVAQGLENSAREDLSFIERALFAARLEAQGFTRSVIQQALTIDRAEASKLIAVATAIPAMITDAIGKAPKIGRGRWQDFAEAIGTEGAMRRVEAALDVPGFATRGSDERFAMLLAAATSKAPPASDTSTILDAEGRVLATIKQGRNGMALILDRQLAPAFGAYLKDELPRLYAAFSAQKPPEN